MPTYKAVAYRQATSPESPLLVTFVATAEELQKWAGIPRRAQGDLVGFQRAADDTRVARAKAFFKIPDNQSPTSLIVGLHPRTSNSGLLTIEFDEEWEAGKVSIGCTIHVADDIDEMPTDATIDAVRTQVESRLLADDVNDPESSSAESFDEISQSDEGSEVIEVNRDDPTLTSSMESLSADEEEPEGDEEVELGSSILRKLVDRLDDFEWVEAHLEDLRELAKPATIIDGQHRVLGAAAVERNIPFTVTAIIDCPWAEQVFQFTVINYTAKGIPDQFITANAALSLTGFELDLLQDRLIQAGVKVIEYELMKVVHFDSNSPFYLKVNLTEKASSELIGYRTMVRIAKAWYEAKDPVFQHILSNLYPDVKGSKPASRRQRLTRWKNDDWGDFFLAFWNVVYLRYSQEPSHVEGQTLWSVGNSQLIVAIVLYMLQQSFIENLGVQDEEYFETGAEGADEAKKALIAKITKRAERFLDSIPPKFFSTKWAWTGLNIGPGRNALEQAFQKLISKKGSYQYAKSALVTGKTDASG